MAGALARLGVDRALVVSSEDGLDEMSTSAPTHVVEVNGDAIERYVVAPEDVGLEPTAPDAVTGRHARGQRGDDARRSWPASPAPRATSRCSTPARRSTPPARPTPSREGVDAAREAVDSGAAARTTDAYLELSRKLAAA